MVEFTAGKQPNMLWIQGRAIIKRKTKEVISGGILIDGKQPSIRPALVVSSTSGFDINLESPTTDEIKTGVPIRHLFYIFVDMREDPLGDVDPQETRTIWIGAKWFA